MYLPIILCALQHLDEHPEWQYVIRRKYSCEQDRLEHLKMSQIFLLTCSTPDIEFLCKEKAVVSQEHEVSHQNHPD